MGRGGNTDGSGPHKDVPGFQWGLDTGPSWEIALLFLGFGTNDLCRILLHPKHRGHHKQLKCIHYGCMDLKAAGHTGPPLY